MRFERIPIFLAFMLLLCLATVPVFGQSLTTGNITGTVYDPAHAVIPGATVTLKGLDTGSSATTWGLAHHRSSAPLRPDDIRNTAPGTAADIHPCARPQSAAAADRRCEARPAERVAACGTGLCSRDGVAAGKRVRMIERARTR